MIFLPKVDKLFKLIIKNNNVMSNSEKTSEKQTKDNFEIIENISNKCFVEIENSVPHFQQTMFDLQNEYYKAWKNAWYANISIQKEITRKTGISFVLPKEIKAIIKSSDEGLANLRALQNKITITSIESTKKNIKMWNKNMETFSNLNKNMMQYWMSLFIGKQKQ